jgi:membrane associated rhomboid family serine protease
MFFIIPWKLRQGTESGAPVANIAIIAINVVCYLLGWSWPVGPGSSLSSILLYAFSHADLWHLVMNMWFLWIFGNAVNRRLGNGYYVLVYLGSAVLLGLFARLAMLVSLVGASGAIFAVIAIALILMPRSTIEIAFVAIFPLALIVGLLSKPAQWWQWLLRSTVRGVPALWALTLVPLMELFLFWWDHWSPSALAHLIGMACGVGAVLLLPARITMRRSSLAGI